MVSVPTIDLEQLIHEIEDPELPHVTIGDLGIVRSVTVDGDTATVLLTPTYTGCPATEQIADDVSRAVRDAGYRPDVRTTLSPAWTTDWITRRVVASACCRPASLPRPTCSTSSSLQPPSMRPHNARAADRAGRD